MKKSHTYVALLVALLGLISQTDFAQVFIAAFSPQRDVTVLISGEQEAQLSDPVFANAFDRQIGNLQAEGTGFVSRILADDINGDAHQRFIVRLRSGQTLLIAHNIDLAPRVPALKIGDEVAFYGEYEWSAEGGVMHWTHHDPAGRHVTGWVKYNGVTYQ